MISTSVVLSSCLANLQAMSATRSIPAAPRKLEDHAPTDSPLTIIPRRADLGREEGVDEGRLA